MGIDTPSHLPVDSPTKHSVLCVRFASSSADCSDTNSQPVTPQEALQRFREGDAWAALAVSGHDVRELTDWLMRLRQDPGGHVAGVLVFLPDRADPGALAALRAGADALLPLDSQPQLIRAQLARLRARIAPQPAGWLQLHTHAHLDGQGRTIQAEIQGQTRTLVLPPQSFHLLWALAAHSGHVQSPQALRLAMDIPARAHQDTLHTAIGRLRRALRPLGLHDHVQTVHGSGYRWSDVDILPALGFRHRLRGNDGDSCGATHE